MVLSYRRPCRRRRSDRRRARRQEWRSGPSDVHAVTAEGDALCVQGLDNVKRACGTCVADCCHLESVASCRDGRDEVTGRPGEGMGVGRGQRSKSHACCSWREARAIHVARLQLPTMLRRAFRRASACGVATCSIVSTPFPRRFLMFVVLALSPSCFPFPSSVPLTRHAG